LPAAGRVIDEAVDDLKTPVRLTQEESMVAYPIELIALAQNLLVYELPSGR
jgi:hypothetical protein